MMSVVLLRGFTRCQARLQNGVNGEGEPIYVNRMFGRIRPETTHQDLYEAIQVVLSLQSLPVRSLRRLDDGELVEG